MLVLKVFINRKQIGEIRIRNLGHCAPITDKEEKCDYRVFRHKETKNTLKGLLFNCKHKVLIKHNRKKGWEILVIKALKKLLKEKK